MLRSYIKEFNSLARARVKLGLSLNSIFNELELELELARILNELSLNTHFITQLELEVGSNKHLRKRASLKILKLDSARLDYSLVMMLFLWFMMSAKYRIFGPLTYIC